MKVRALSVSRLCRVQIYDSSTASAGNSEQRGQIKHLVREKIELILFPCNCTFANEKRCKRTLLQFDLLKKKPCDNLDTYSGTCSRSGV